MFEIPWTERVTKEVELNRIKEKRPLYGNVFSLEENTFKGVKAFKGKIIWKEMSKTTLQEGGIRDTDRTHELTKTLKELCVTIEKHGQIYGYVTVYVGRRYK